MYLQLLIFTLILHLSSVTPTEIISLDAYNLRKDAVTLSGFSAGASIATQVHVSHSSLFHGVALFSQAFYRCGPSFLLEFGLRCSTLGQGLLPYNVQQSVADARLYDKLGLIDPLSNLWNQRVFLWTGDLDEYIPPEMALENVNFYSNFVPMESINSTLFHAKHLLPTTNFGSACDQNASANVYLGNCQYSGAFHALEFLLRDKIPIINPFQGEGHKGHQGQLMAYNQSEFYVGDDIKDIGMGSTGFIYVPHQCQGSSGSGNLSTDECFLHINFHGCNEWPPQVALRYITNSGFLEVADTNGILTLFPLSTKVPQNMDGCWDFFSFTGPLFATKHGKQVQVVKAIISRVLGTSS